MLGLFARPEGQTWSTGEPKDPHCAEVDVDIANLGLTVESAEDRTVHCHAAKAINLFALACAQMCIDAKKANLAGECTAVHITGLLDNNCIIGLWFRGQAAGMDNANLGGDVGKNNLEN
eukprot:219729-Amphidinium_carterae.1